jgi:hypothetical protein
MTKVRIITSAKLSSFEERINAFTQNKSIKDITFHITESNFIAFIVYEEIKNESHS